MGVMELWKLLNILTSETKEEPRHCLCAALAAGLLLLFRMNEYFF